MQALPQARVPLLKLTHTASGAKVDLALQGRRAALKGRVLAEVSLIDGR